MQNCLVTKTKGLVNNDDLLKIGEGRIVIQKIASPTKNTQGFYIQTIEDVKLSIIGEGYFTDENLQTNKGKEVQLTANTPVILYVSNNDCEISFPKYKIINFIDTNSSLSTALSTNALKNKKLNIDYLKYSKDLTSLGLSHTQVSGDISSLSNLTNLTSLGLSNTQVSGDISNLSNLTNLTSLNMFNMLKISGDISSLSNLTKLTSLAFSNSIVQGNIAAFNKLFNCTYLVFSNTQVSGDISNLSNLTNLTSLGLSSTQVSGNISSLSNLTNLTSLGLSDTQVSGDISSLSNLTKLTSLGLSNTTVPISGSIDSLKNMSNLKEAQLRYSTLRGDLALLPPKCRFVSFLNDKESSFTWSTRPTSSVITAIEGKIKVDNVDKMLINLAQCQVGIINTDSYWYKAIYIIGTRTSASDEAVATLQSKGYTVSVTPES